MARTNSKTNLEALRQQQLEIVRKIKEAEAEEKQKERERDERRKLLAGAEALAELEENPSGAFATTLLRRLNDRLARAADRELFDLPALPKEAKPAAAPVVEAGGVSVGNG